MFEWLSLRKPAYLIGMAETLLSLFLSAPIAWQFVRLNVQETCQPVPKFQVCSTVGITHQSCTTMYGWSYDELCGPLHRASLQSVGRLSR